ncbi:metallophosphoesterase [Microcoleus sp. FACHB-1515]|uniref:metallophosphoesterase n=1 Tax=Cyanophyceae TaxID=3028117 RepID=UPI001688EBB7|nr:metallophosphoesterase [Microcoleus sp. FACHB-1515]MBD2089621.1 metallophosphoesterase [Microcoleus sp. FACHB-1515]
MHSIFSGSLRVEPITVTIANLPPALAGCRIVQMSDFHYDGLRLRESLLNEAIAACNRAQPDLIALTGDYVTDDPSPIEPLVDRLRRLKSRCGLYAVLGNHDLRHYDSKDKITRTLEAAGITVLWNQIAYPFGADLPIVGLPDFRSRSFDPHTLDRLADTTPRLVLSHNPDSAAVLAEKRVDLQLSGHTHGGQVVIPGLKPLPAWIPTIARCVPKPMRQQIPYLRKSCRTIVQHWEWSQGLHQVGNNQLYVNRGLGTYLPGRLFCPPEVTVITLLPGRSS